MRGFVAVLLLAFVATAFAVEGIGFVGWKRKFDDGSFSGEMEGCQPFIEGSPWSKEFCYEAPQGVNPFDMVNDINPLPNGGEFNLPDDGEVEKIDCECWVEPSQRSAFQAQMNYSSNGGKVPSFYVEGERKGEVLCEQTNVLTDGKVLVGLNFTVEGYLLFPYYFLYYTSAIEKCEVELMLADAYDVPENRTFVTAWTVSDGHPIAVSFVLLAFLGALFI